MRGSSVGGRRGESAGEPQVERERLACDWVAGRMMTVDSSVGMVVRWERRAFSADRAESYSSDDLRSLRCVTC